MNIKLEEIFESKTWKWFEKMDELQKEIQENFIEGYLNEEDLDVGIYSIGKINKGIVEEINENSESFRVIDWTDYLLEIDVDDTFFVTIELVNKGKDFDGGNFYDWEITEMKVKKHIANKF